MQFFTEGTSEYGKELLKGKHHFLAMAVSCYCRRRGFIHTYITEFFLYCWANFCKLNILKMATNFVALVLRTQLKMSANALKSQGVRISKQATKMMKSSFCLAFSK